MANTKQAKKMIRKIKSKTAYNRWWKGKVKDAYKTLITSLSTTDMTVFQRSVDKAVKNGVIKVNKANRMKSQTAKKLTKKD